LYECTHRYIRKTVRRYRKRSDRTCGGDLDPDGFLGKNEDVRQGFSEIRYSIEIDSPSSETNIEALLTHVQSVCPVKDTLEGTNVILQQ